MTDLTPIKEGSTAVTAADPMVSMIERLVLDPEVSIEKLERMLDMKERLDGARAKSAYDAAFAAMQADMPEISERGEIKVHGKVQSKYALFEDINEAVKPILAKHGFGISFRTERADGQMIIHGILSHREGHREQDSLPLPLDTSGSKNNVQAVGSSLSYGKRYILMNMLNISTRGADDDGRAAGSSHTISSDQFFALRNLIERAGADEARFCKFMKVEHLEELPTSQFDSAISNLNAKIRKQGGANGAAQ